MKTRINRSIVMIAILAILTGCAGGAGLRIGNSLSLCCPGSYASYSTYAVESLELPVFLRDYMVAQFDTAFQERGMTRNDQRSDIVVNFAYRHVSLDPEQHNIDPFIRMESMNVELHYIAIMDITMRERISGKEIWGGQINRIHSVQPGEYMHQADASAAFLETFRDLLQQYPSRYDE